MCVSEREKEMERENLYISIYNIVVRNNQEKQFNIPQDVLLFLFFCLRRCRLFFSTKDCCCFCYYYYLYLYYYYYCATTVYARCCCIKCSCRIQVIYFHNFKRNLFHLLHKQFSSH